MDFPIDSQKTLEVIERMKLAKIGEYDRAIIALDPDAVGKTIEYRREIQLWTGKTTMAISLADDIKYRMPEDMEKLWEATQWDSMQ